MMTPRTTTTTTRKEYSKVYYQDVIKPKLQKKKELKLIPEAPQTQTPGEYNDFSKSRSYNIVSEDSLHLAFIKWFKEEYPNALVMSLPIDRIDWISTYNKGDSIKKLLTYGYQRGTRDIMIYHKNGMFSGVAIELKRPVISLLTAVSENQDMTLSKLRSQGWKTVVSNDLLFLVSEMTKYMS